MDRDYSLRVYDDELVTFRLEEKGLEGLQALILSVNEQKRALFPLDLELSDTGMLRWLKHRVIPKNRTFANEILKTVGLSPNNTKGILDVCKGLSLNDSYWVVPFGFDGRFGDLNLYENRFSEELASVAYTGTGAVTNPVTCSPEFTTHGMLRKAWQYSDRDGIRLFKGGSGFADVGKEPYSEYYACQIAQVMGLNAVTYDLAYQEGAPASVCKLFTDIDTSFVPVGRILKHGGITACLAYYESLGTAFSESLKSMLVFDAVVYNEDRHFGNFGLLRDNHTGKILSPAPIFDNGMSLFHNAVDGDLYNLEAYAKTRTNPYGVSYEVVCAAVIGEVQKRQLEKLIGFTFRRHPRINLPEDRLTAIEQHLQVRIHQLLSLSDTS